MDSKRGKVKNIGMLWKGLNKLLRMKNDVTVSVLMTAYNREKYIAEAIESVLASTYTNFELLIVDDGSDDSTVSIASKYASKDSRITVHVNEKNLGDYPNRNKAASYAKGPYLKYVDSDDTLYPDGLRYCVQCMEDHKDAEWAIIYPREIPEEFLMEPQPAIESHFFREPFLKAGPGQTIIKRDFFNRIGMYPVNYGPASDMYFNLLAASKGNTLVIKDNFLFYRRHDDQEQSNQFSYLYNYNNYLRDALENIDMPLTTEQINWLQKKRKRRFAVNLVNYFLRTGNFSKTREACLKTRFSFGDFFTGLLHIDHKPEVTSAVNALPDSIWVKGDQRI
jgi:glycosyltransferase involved in cell wall biosynthesis